MREDPPFACFVVDELSLYRCVGSPAVMAAQMHHLLTVASMPKVTVQVLPAIEHPVNASGFLIADAAVWAGHAASGYVFTDEQTVSAPAVRFDTLRGECYRVPESPALIERLGEIWANWRKSSNSDGNGGNCVEVGTDARVVLVRDTTDRDGGTLAFTAEAWQRFTNALR